VYHGTKFSWRCPDCEKAELLKRQAVAIEKQNEHLGITNNSYSMPGKAVGYLLGFFVAFPLLYASISIQSFFYIGLSIILTIYCLLLIKLN